MPFDHPNFNSDVQDQIEIFASDVNNRVRIPDTTNTGLSGTDLNQLNTLIGGLMHPDPQQRPTLTQALQNPLFQQPGVGSAQARAVIQQITT